jgi:alkane 1-monooxygenase
MSLSYRTSVRVLECYAPYALLGSLTFGLLLRGAWHLSPLLLLFAIVPLLDSLFPKDRRTFETNNFTRFQLGLCRLSPYGFIAIYAILLFSYLHVVRTLRPYELIAATLSLGAVGSVDITAAHELIHKHSPLAKLLARLGLLLVGHLHFEYSHLRGHHVHVGTAEDNHTAIAGETYLHYLVRTTRGALYFCIQYERSRLARQCLGIWTYHNRLLWFFGLPLLLCAAVCGFYGTLSAMVFIVQATIAVTSLEAVAYIEHYGITRRQIGRSFEPMNASHSWESYHRFSNHMTFMLQRHSDHHIHPARDFFLLAASHGSPELPSGYPLLILLTMTPRHWFRVIGQSARASMQHR